MNRPLVVHITGNPNITGLKMVNVRAQPNTESATAVLFQALVGTRSLTVLDCKPDDKSNALNGKVYQWFKVRFPSTIEGWLRDDLISLEGDGRPYGYPDLTTTTYGFSLLRQLLPSVITTPAPLPTPAPIPAPIPSPAPTPPIAPAPAPKEVIGKVIAKEGLRLRKAPVTGTEITRIPFGAQVTILDADPQGGTSNYFWAKVPNPLGTGFVRTDYLSIIGNGSAFGLSVGDEYPAPMANYWWIRGFNIRQNPNEEDHLGWDFGGNVGEPVRCGPLGGRVMRLFTCTRCTPDKPSTISQGLPLNDNGVFLDPGWGFGYGNAVIVRYLNTQLPESTRQRLASRGLSGAHLYAIYAHLSSIQVSEGMDLPPNAMIGGCGNTGNSTGAHVHLEIRASFGANDPNWTSMRPNLLDPGVLYLR